MARPATAGLSVRDEIVRAAAALFRERGYAMASLRDVAASVGMSKAGLYHHFASKDKILEAVYERAVDVLEAGLREVQAAEGTEARLRALIVGRVRDIAEEQDVMTVFWQERPWIAPEILAGLERRLHEYRRAILELVEAGQRDGVLSRDLDPHILLLGLDGMTGWLYLWYRPGRLSVEEIGDQLWRLGWSGVRGPAEAARSGDALGRRRG